MCVKTRQGKTKNIMYSKTAKRNKKNWKIIFTWKCLVIYFGLVYTIISAPSVLLSYFWNRFLDIWGPENVMTYLLPNQDLNMFWGYTSDLHEGT